MNLRELLDRALQSYCEEHITVEHPEGSPAPILVDGKNCDAASGEGRTCCLESQHEDYGKLLDHVTRVVGEDIRADIRAVVTQALGEHIDRVAKHMADVPMPPEERREIEQAIAHLQAGVAVISADHSAVPCLGGQS